jgi:hypothetical protein
MKRVEFWLWGIWSLQGTKKVRTRHRRMTVAEALARHPEAVRVEGSCEIRDIPETPEEAADEAFRMMTPSGSSRRPE